MDIIWIEIGFLKHFKECARLPCNGNHFTLSGNLITLCRGVGIRGAIAP